MTTSTSPGALFDFRSDTVSKPTPAMLDQMMQARVGDDVYGEDPTVLELEAEVAALLGKEAALYVPSGTMANQLAIAVHARHGDSIIAEQDCHIFVNEAGAAAALSGVQFDIVPLGQLSAEAVSACYRADSLHTSPTRLVLVENTHNLAGGRVMAAGKTQAIAAEAHRLGLATHCDGARLWNAAVALSVSERELAEGFDTLAVCFSKGLGAAVGSALVGSRAHIEKARKLRKRWGGGMRQAGYIAAGALYGLRHHRARLAEDHRLASMIAAQLRTAGGFDVVYPEPGTNMVFVRIADGADPIARSKRMVLAMQRYDVLSHMMGQGWIRLVTHLDLPKDAATRVCEALLAAVRETN